MKRWIKKNRDHKRDYGLDWLYGKGAAEWKQARFAASEGRCELCGTECTYSQLHLDHNHETGEWRGLLCSTCNTHFVGGFETFMKKSGLGPDEAAEVILKYLS